MGLEMIADVLLIAGTVAAALYCLVLARRLRRFNNLENGMGGAIAVLSAQVDDMTKTLDRAEASAKVSAEKLVDLAEKGDAAARRLELLLASMHDLPSPSSPRREEKPTAEAEAPAEASPRIANALKLPDAVDPLPPKDDTDDESAMAARVDAAPVFMRRSARTGAI
ncbi:MAG: hypothetical protein AAF667_17865 [Pseudomonadota bacterium]